jgi:F-type H+-transporting ATPase subunit delta
MAKDNLIAKKYAEALVEVDASETTLEDLKLVKATFQENPNLNTALENPGVKEETKLKILEEVFKSSISATSLNILKLCITKRRTNLITLLAAHYETAFLNKNNIALACVETPTEISDNELEEIKGHLEKVFNKGIKIEAKNNPDLIAGVKINVNNKVIDYSLNSKIKKLNQSLKS